MEKEEQNYSVGQSGCFQGMDYSLDPHQNLLLHHHPNIGENSSIVDYIPTPLPAPPPPQASTCLDKLSLADVMQFADFGPKLALNQPKFSDDYGGVDPAGCMLKFPVLSNKLQQPAMMGPSHGAAVTEEGEEEWEEEYEEEHTERRSTRLRIMGSGSGREGKSQRRKKPRSLKTSEEVESQRMTHIAVERNRRKQMNEHLRVLRSLMPGSYVQRGDQASIIGGAIEFVRELEQLLQCLESQKRRRLLGSAEGGPRHIEDSPSLAITPSPQTPFFPSLPIPNDETKFDDFEDGPLCEESAEIKSCLADIEVKLLGQDAMIKVLSRRRPGQLLKTIAALEDLQFNILHTNITTIEQTVLYSFIVKIASESRFTAEDISNTVQQIFNFIHASSI